MKHNKFFFNLHIKTLSFTNHIQLANEETQAPKNKGLATGNY